MNCISQDRKNSVNWVCVTSSHFFVWKTLPNCIKLTYLKDAVQFVKTLLHDILSKCSPSLYSEEKCIKQGVCGLFIKNAPSHIFPNIAPMRPSTGGLPLPPISTVYKFLYQTEFIWCTIMSDVIFYNKMYMSSSCNFMWLPTYDPFVVTKLPYNQI